LPTAPSKSSQIKVEETYKTTHLSNLRRDIVTVLEDFIRLINEYPFRIQQFFPVMNITGGDRTAQIYHKNVRRCNSETHILDEGK